MAARQWEPIVAEMSRVMKLVHLAMRMDALDESRITNQVLTEKRDSYVSELTSLAKEAGCNKKGSLRPGVVQKEMVAESETDASSITNTYNYDLAHQINAIRSAVPTANRNVYAKRLQVWDAERNKWKSTQISLWDTGRWKARATSDFLAHNDIKGSARLMPKDAAEEVCQFWAKKGWMRLTNAVQERISTWPPHLNCPHFWEVKIGKVADCSKLWVG